MVGDPPDLLSSHKRVDRPVKAAILFRVKLKSKPLLNWIEEKTTWKEPRRKGGKRPSDPFFALSLSFLLNPAPPTRHRYNEANRISRFLFCSCPVNSEKSTTIADGASKSVQLSFEEKNVALPVPPDMTLPAATTATTTVYRQKMSSISQRRIPATRVDSLSKSHDWMDPTWCCQGVCLIQLRLCSLLSSIENRFFCSVFKFLPLGGSRELVHRVIFPTSFTPSLSLSLSLPPYVDNRFLGNTWNVAHRHIPLNSRRLEGKKSLLNSMDPFYGGAYKKNVRLLSRLFIRILPSLTTTQLATNQCYTFSCIGITYTSSPISERIRCRCFM